MNSLQQKLTDLFGLDFRSLAVMRIGLGLTLLLDLMIRAMDLPAMIAGDGILPMAKSIKMGGPAGWSLHWISGELWFAWLLWSIALVFAIGMLVGYRTRWMVIGSFVLLASIHTRNPLLLNGGDGMFRILLFWAIFLPLGRAWSLDAYCTTRLRRVNSPDGVGWYKSVTSFCFILQLCLVYWFAGAAKLNETWLGFDPVEVASDPSLLMSATAGGDAMERALHYDIYTKPAADLLLQMPWLLRGVCLGTLVLEILVPILLFIPFRTNWLRLFVIASFVMLHLGIELTLHVGLFTWVALSAWAALLPAVFWESKIFRAISPSPVGKGSHDVPILRSRRRQWIAYTCYTIIPSTICAVLMTVALAWNFSYCFQKDIKADIQRPIRPIVNATMLRQQWNMFSKPGKSESWFVYRAELHNGQVVDIFQNGQPVSMEKPADLSATFTNHRWRKLHVNLCSSRFKRYRQGVADCLCRRWNAAHDADQQIVKMQLYRLREKADIPAECTASLCLTIEPSSESDGEHEVADQLTSN